MLKVSELIRMRQGKHDYVNFNSLLTLRQSFNINKLPCKIVLNILG